MQGLYVLDRSGMAVGDVKLDNLMVDFAYFFGDGGGDSPLVKPWILAWPPTVPSGAVGMHCDTLPS